MKSTLKMPPAVDSLDDLLFDIDIASYFA